MEIIGESMHVMNPRFLKALEDLDEESLIQLARCQVEAGATALDINLGQNRKLGRRTPWLVETIQREVEVPLFLSSHVLDQQRALEIHHGRPTINAVTASREQLARAMDVTKYFQASLVVLLVSDELTPMDVDGRLILAMQVMETAEKIGLEPEQLYLDPVIGCRPDPASWNLSAGLPDIDVILETLGLIRELSTTPPKTLVAISNSSLCLARNERSAFHCRLLPLLADAGLDAVIMNCLDTRLMAVAENPNLILADAA
ncbi:dihydropteroate synthase [Desulfolithobacter sp.]